MKHKFLASILFLPFLGCGAVKTTTPPVVLAPGYANAADQQMGNILSGARTFYSTVQCETKGLNWSQSTAQCVSDPNITTPMILSATEKTAFNHFGAVLNAAESVYVAFHNGTATEAAAQTAVNEVQSEQNALPALAVTK